MSGPPLLPLRRVFLRDMMLQAQIGVYQHEHGRRQRLRVNVELGVLDQAAAPGADDLARVVDYEQVVLLVRRIVGEGHVKLVETLVERIAEAILRDRRIRRVVVRAEKLDVFEDLAAVGVEIERHAPEA